MRYNEIKPLMEINMSPSSLKQLASGIDATIGIEFEMIIPDVPVPDDEEFVDYPDEILDSMDKQKFIDFFYVMDGSNSLTEVNSAISQLETEFSEYLYNFIPEELEDGEINQYIFDKLYDKEYSVYQDKAIKILKNKNKHMSEDEIDDLVNELIHNTVSELQNEDETLFNDYYDMCMNELVSKRKGDLETQKKFLEYKNYHTMGNISNIFGLQWPTYVDSDSSDMEALRDNFAKFVDEEVKITPSYHGITDYSSWVIQPDGSIKYLKSENDGGWELVSPKLPLSDLYKVIGQVQQFSNQFKCYTNRSCGLHINLSINGIDMNNLDYIKLVLLLGDNYVLDEFARTFNKHCSSAIDEIYKSVKYNNEFIDSSLKKMKSDMEKYSKELYKRNVYRQSSVNAINSNRIEFRAPGGDWLGILNNYPEKMTNTILRMAVAVDAAVDKNKYRNEYIKKFYKLVNITTPQNHNNTMELFVAYVSGNLSINELKYRLNDIQKRRQRDKDLEKDIDSMITDYNFNNEDLV